LAGNDSPCAFDDDSWQRAAVSESASSLRRTGRRGRGAEAV